MPERPRVAVGAIVVRDGALLMVRRAREPARGLWTVPGGDVEVRDLMGIFEVVGEPHFVILDFVAVAAGNSPPQPGDDVSDVRWVPLEEVPRLECTPRFVETLRGWGVLSSAEEQGH